MLSRVRLVPGELDHTYSVASTTGEFIRRTFRNQEFPDIVCVTSTPKYAKEESISGQSIDDVFFQIQHVWRDEWDEDLELVHPEVMTEKVLEAERKYPDKRILAHYIPPHVPFIGELGHNIPHRRLTPHGDDVGGKPNVWSALKRGEYTEDEVWNAYKENLEVTLPSVKRAPDELTGKAVVTSDHGNALGKWSDFGYVGHGANHHLNSLIKVPWLVYQNTERKDVVEGDMTGVNEGDVIDQADVSDRLRDLGYTE